MVLSQKSQRLLRSQEHIGRCWFTTRCKRLHMPSARRTEPRHLPRPGSTKPNRDLANPIEGKWVDGRCQSLQAFLGFKCEADRTTHPPKKATGRWSFFLPSVGVPPRPVHGPCGQPRGAVSEGSPACPGSCGPLGRVPRLALFSPQTSPAHIALRQAGNMDPQVRNIHGFELTRHLGELLDPFL